MRESPNSQNESRKLTIEADTQVSSDYALPESDLSLKKKKKRERFRQ